MNDAKSSGFSMVRRRRNRIRAPRVNARERERERERETVLLQARNGEREPQKKGVRRRRRTSAR
jgi:hypothetical protein